MFRAGVPPHCGQSCAWAESGINAKAQRRKDATELREAFGVRELATAWNALKRSKLHALQTLRVAAQPSQYVTHVTHLTDLTRFNRHPA